ncbi:MAG: hypothetical protein FH751_07225 [Firmicutes bacterium]|nr:hypothetical protein [Bacillota bacterium]
MDKKEKFRAVLGFVLCQTDETMEYNTRIIGNKFDNVDFRFNRISMDSKLDKKTYKRMEKNIAKGSSMFNPNTIDILSFVCTSCCFYLGIENVNKKLLQGRNNKDNNFPIDNRLKSVTNTAEALLKAIKKMGLKNIALLTPYINELNEIELNWFEREGINVLNYGIMELNYDRDISKVKKEYIIKALKKLDDDNIEGFVISCTSLRTLQWIDELEKKFNKTIITSNQAHLWYVLRLSGIKERKKGLGKLFKKY